jgi:inosine-uridine nucleoside N-ribohydrolase
MAEKTPFIIDTDCGVDDAVAIMMALADPEVELAGVTTVGGNVAVLQVTENVRRLLAYFGHSEVPIYQGAAASLLLTEVRASGIHGENGLGNVELPEPGDAPAGGGVQTQSAPEGLATLLDANPGATVVALAPLTNLAIAFNLYPGLAEKVGRLVIMGGAINEGNVTKFAEFNFYADPEAAQAVLNTGLEIELLPWDPCLRHQFARKDLDAIGMEEGRGKEFFDKLQSHMFGVTEELYGMPIAMHPDPFAMACALDPGVAKSTFRSGITMELTNNTMRGMSVRSDGNNVVCIMDLDMERYAALLRRIGSLRG